MMHLLKIIGGRVDVGDGSIAYRNRLPSPDDNPLNLFTTSYGLTPTELTALIGGAGYAAWRGGEKAAHVGSRKMEDMKRERRRNEEQRDYNQKAKQRNNRLNEIQERITAAKNGSVSAGNDANPG